MFMIKKIIVTGAAGFLGANLVDILSEQNFEVYAVVRPNAPHNERLADLNNVHIIELDIRKISELSDILNLKNETIDYFFHIAWHGKRNDFAEQKQNIDEAVKTLEVAAKLGCKRWIATGTQAEYGARTDLLTEDLAPNPFCAYGAAKVATCYLTRNKASALGIDWIWGRIFSLYGKFEPKGRMLPDLISKLRDGQTVSLSSCTQYWNYLDARDAANALIALAKTGKTGEIYNIAAEESRPLKEYVEIMHKMFGAGVPITYGEPPVPFVSLQASIEKLKQDTGWWQEILFEDGLREAYIY